MNRITILSSNHLFTGKIAACMSVSLVDIIYFVEDSDESACCIKVML